MKKNLLLIPGLVLSLLFQSQLLLAQEQKKDTVSVGIYITSIHDIDF